MIEISGVWLSQTDCDSPPGCHRSYFEIYCNWMAVELFDDRRIIATSKETDVWAFGMTILVRFDRPTMSLGADKKDRRY